MGAFYCMQSVIFVNLILKNACRPAQALPPDRAELREKEVFPTKHLWGGIEGLIAWGGRIPVTTQRVREGRPRVPKCSAGSYLGMVRGIHCQVPQVTLFYITASWSRVMLIVPA